MATILHFATICGILCLMNGTFGHKDSHKAADKPEDSIIKHPAMSGPIRGKSHFKNLKSSDENILIRSDSPLRGRTIHQTAWSEEEKENSLSSEVLKSSANEKDIMKPENLKKFLKYVMKVVHKLEEQEKQEHKKVALNIKKDKIAVEKYNLEISNKDASKVVRKNKPEKSSVVPEDADIEKLFSVETQNYLSTFFQSGTDSKTSENHGDENHTNATVKLTEVHKESDSNVEAVKKYSKSTNSKIENLPAGHLKSQKINQVISSKNGKESTEKVTEDLLLNIDINEKLIKPNNIENINLKNKDKKISSIILNKPNEIRDKDKILETKKVEDSKLENYSISKEKIKNSVKIPNAKETTKLESDIKENNNPIIAGSKKVIESQSKTSEKNIVRILNGTKKENDNKDSKHFNLKKIEVPIPNRKIKLPQNSKVKNLLSKDENKLLTDLTEKSNLTMQNNMIKTVNSNNTHNNSNHKILKNQIKKLKEDNNSERTDDVTTDFKFSKQTKSIDINGLNKQKSLTNDKQEKNKNSDIFTDIISQPLDTTNENKINMSSSKFHNILSHNVKNKYDNTHLESLNNIKKNAETQNKFENETLKIEHAELSNSQNLLQNSNAIQSFSTNKINNQAKDKNVVYSTLSGAAEKFVGQKKLENKNTNVDYTSQKEHLKSQSVHQSPDATKHFTTNQKNKAENQNIIFGFSDSIVKNSINQNKIQNENTSPGYISYSKLFNSHNLLQGSNVIQNFAHDGNKHQKEKQNVLYSVSGIENSMNQNKFENKNTNFGYVGHSEHFNSQGLFQNSNGIQNFANDQDKSQVANQNFIYSASDSTIGNSFGQKKFENEKSNIVFTGQSEFYNSNNIVQSYNAMQNIATDHTTHLPKNQNNMKITSSGGYHKIIENGVQKDESTFQIKSDKNLILAPSRLASIKNNKVSKNAANENKDNFLRISKTINSKVENTADNTISKVNKVTNSYNYILTSNEFIDVNESFDAYDSEYDDSSCEYEYEDDIDEKDVESRDSSQLSSSLSIQEEEIDAKTQKTYNTILEYLYKHSKNPFFVALKKRSEKYSSN